MATAAERFGLSRATKSASIGDHRDSTETELELELGPIASQRN